MTRRQLGVLYRQFLFRIVDLEVLSAHAQGDASKLLGQFAALLVFVSAGFSLGAIFGRADPRPGGESVDLVLSMVTQHFLIATTMLVVGLFAVLSWDAVFPDRRDVMVLAPLPVQARTMFVAKVAAVATALGLTILLLHCAAGLAWPLAFAAKARPALLPALSFEPALAPAGVGDLEGLLGRDLKLSLAPGEGMAIGVWKAGERRVFTYGAAKPDSLYEIGSISKTFTGLMLARMVAAGQVRFDEPVRELLPRGTVAKPAGEEVTLLDLVTHRSGLPQMPRNFRPADKTNPYADYGPRELYAYLARQGVAKPLEAGYRYSNLGLGLLGQALAERSGKSYPDLLRELVTGPLGLRDTVVQLSAEQEGRFLQGYDDRHRPVRAWDLDALAGAGAIRSTAGDMLTYLEANLHPERSGAMAAAVAASHRLRAYARGGAAIALAWSYNDESGSYSHGGSTAGFNTFALFNPRADTAVVVLMNNSPRLIPPNLIADHVRQRLSGEPAISLGTVLVPAAGSSGFAGIARSYGAYWFTMLAAGLFIFGACLVLQGLTAQLLPRRLFLRVSGYLQLAAFCAIICVYFLQPGFGGLNELGASSIWRLVQWLPSYWFLGLYQELNGSLHPALEPLARRAWIALAVVACASAAAYTLSYRRTLRRIAEEPDIVPGARRWGWLPGFGGQVETAIGQFSIRTLARSRQHRMILAFYLGVGLALTSLLLKDPATRRQLEDGAAAATNQWREVSIPLWAASMIMMALAVVGTRVVFALPLDLRANWIFRITGVQDGRASRTGGRRALLLIAVAPVWLMESTVCLGLWPSWQSAAHLTALALLGMIAAELCLLQLRKLPFACSYLPGRSRFHMAFLGAMALELGSIKAALLERQALREAGTTALMLAGLAAVWVGVRIAAALARGEDRELHFEEEETPAVQVLGLNRDGVMAME